MSEEEHSLPKEPEANKPSGLSHSTGSGLAAFWAELKRRKVMRVAITYAVVAWLIMQVAGLTFEGFGVPIWAFRFVVIVLWLFFPVAIILTWAFELTPEGIKTTKNARESQGEEPVSKTHLRKRNWMALGFAAALPTMVFGALAIYFYATRSARLESELASSEQVEEIEKSIAVLPLESMSPDPENAFFADGVQEDILTNLNKVNDLLVIGRISTLRYKDTTKSPQQIGRELGARYLVVGSVRRYSNQAKVTVQLIDSQTGGQLWADDYDRKLDDIFSIQADIALSIAEELEAVLSPEEIESIERIPTNDLLAYEMYLQGLEYEFEATNRGYIQSIERFDAAIKRDPDFLLAYIGKARSYRQRMTYFEPPIEMLSQVRTLASEAFELDPESAVLRSVLGMAYLQSWHWADSWRYLSEAKLRDPRIGETHMALGVYYSGLGEESLAFDAFTEANKQDPLNPEIAQHEIFSYYLLGRLGVAVELAEEKIGLFPSHGLVLFNAGIVYSALGNHQKAIQVAEKALDLNPDAPFFGITLSHVYSYAGRMEDARRVLKIAEQSDMYVCPYETAIAYILLGDIDTAFELMDKAVDFRSNCLIYTRLDPRLDLIRSDPRYTKLLERVGLDDLTISKYPR